MWAIRIILLCMFWVLDGSATYLLRYRSRYKKLLEGKIFNTAVVIVSHCLCYLTVGLPPAKGWNARPVWLEYTSVRFGFTIVGLLLICAGALLAITALKQRKVIGIQDVKEGLLTSGCYRYFRHPINTGMLWVSLGLAVMMRNPDGLLVFPALFAIFFIMTIYEEKNDMLTRFHEQYQIYRQTTRMFGPIWLWSVVIVIMLLMVGLGSM